MSRINKVLAGLFLSSIVCSVQAAAIETFSPLGDVAEVYNIKVGFAEPVISLGRTDSPAPVLIECNGQALNGDAKWADTKNWQLDLLQPLGSGMDCHASVNPEFTDVKGKPLAKVAPMRFSTGDIRLRNTRPWADSTVDEDQVFVLNFDTPVKPSSLQEKAVCAIDGIGEQVPVRLIEGKDREAILEDLYYADNEKNNLNLVQCSRNLPTQGKVALIIQAGLESEKGWFNRKPISVNYEVRGPFTASMVCTRAKPNAFCSPLGDIDVRFNSPIKAQDSQLIKLTIDGKEVAQEVNYAGDSRFNDTAVHGITFKGPFTPNGTLLLTLPKGLRDDAGRALANADKFPITSKLDNFPSLLKFASGNFGIIETYAEAEPGADLNQQPALVPLTIRNIEKDFKLKGLAYEAGKVAVLNVKNDQEAIRWMGLMDRFESGKMRLSNIERVLKGLDLNYNESTEAEIDVRNFSLLAKHKEVAQMQLPSLADSKNEAEVIGIPINKPGFYVLEASSTTLGKNLTETGEPMYVRSTVLVTNLSTHLKCSNAGALVWVTRLNDGQSVKNAQVQLFKDDGSVIAKGTTNDQGVFQYDDKIVDCYKVWASTRIAADHPQSYGQADYSLVSSSWNDGIQTWMFNLPNEYNYSNSGSDPQLITHTLLDRTLFRAGETVSMKHYIRLQTKDGLVAPVSGRDQLPNELVINLVALDEEVRQPLKWVKTASGSMQALSQWKIPENSKNGVYRVSLEHNNGVVDSQGDAEFRVEEFKLPLLTGTIALSSEQQVGTMLVNPQVVNANIQVNYIVGGGATELPVQVSAMLVPNQLQFDQHNQFQFNAVSESSSEDSQRKIIMDKQAAKLDANGQVNLQIKDILKQAQASDLIVEVSFMDPNGQIQTLSQTASLVPSAVLAGIQAEYAYLPNKEANFQVLTIDPLGKVQANIPVSVKATRSDYLVVRKRLLGGFYSYDYQQFSENLGEICQGVSDEYGRFVCKAALNYKGEITLMVSVEDAQKNSYVAQASTYVDEWAYWLGLSDTDRTDVIANKASYEVGEEAVFDVRMPFQEASALVAIEREGVIDYRIMPLGKENSKFTLKIEPEWAPNAYVSVLAVRGRIRGERGDSGVVWGNDPGQSGGANALVDLAKPSFRFGVVGFSVFNPEQQLKLNLQMDKPGYQIRQKAKVAIEGQFADGKPAAKANVAVFVVDKALLELSPNNTTDLYKAMMRERRLDVETATAQSEVVGRRHYGRKAIPAGGGGGRAPTRELFDSLIFWQGDAVLDEQGKANVEFTLNDSISKFEVVVVADYAQDKFGQAKLDFVSTQDLQLISGLPLLSRDRDQFQAPLTLRNATAQEMQVTVKAKALRGGKPIQSFADQQVTLPANSSQTLYWETLPIQMLDTDTRQTINWQFDAQASTGARDSIRVKQDVVSHVPVTVRQSELMSVPSGEMIPALDVQLPKNALRLNDKWRGGLQVNLQPTLATSLEGARQFFIDYPYTCYEQRSSIAIGLNSQERWNALMDEINVHLDEHGLVKYFPSGYMHGSPILTAYLLSVTADARKLGWDFKLPEQAQERMLNALEKVVNGNLPIYDWMPKEGNSRLRLNLIAALARYNMATVNMINRYSIDQSYTSDSLLDLYTIIRSFQSYPNKQEQLKAISQAIAQRLDRQGTQIVFHEREAMDGLWWMMIDRRVMQAKLLFAMMNEPAWAKDIPYLVQGLAKSQDRGHWGTSTGNLWAILAMNYFTQNFEKVPAEGHVNMSVSGSDYAEANTWENLGVKQRVLAPWRGDAPAKLDLSLQGKGRVWATVSALAAVENTEAQYAGYKIKKTVEPISQAVSGEWRVGDTYRVRLEIDAASSMTWAVVSDPIPAGASILGGGLGRDSIIENQVQESDWWSGPSFIERKSEVYRAYYGYLPSGQHTLEYAVRLNTVGNFVLPSTRVEGLYAPETYGELPNATMQVKAQ